LPTILGYGHGDEILGQEGAWSESANPFKLRQEGDWLYGRGTADNKGQHLANLLALECVIAARGRLGLNATWLIEMGGGDQLANSNRILRGKQSVACGWRSDCFGRAADVAAGAAGLYYCAWSDQLWPYGRAARRSHHSGN
jgi:hypothetical protein